MKALLNIFILCTIFLFTGCQQSQRALTVGVKDNPLLLSRLTGNYWQIWTMQPDGSNLRQMTTSESDKRYPSWMQESGKMLYRTNNNNAFILDIMTGQEERILTNLGLIGSVCQSPVGEDLLVTRFRTEVLDSSDLWIVSPSGQNQRILTRDVGLQYDPVWSPDGSKIAYISGHGYQTHELIVMDSDSSNKIQLTDNKALELLPMFSPDGEEIAYVSDLGGNYDIWVMDSDGQNPRQMTEYAGIDTRPYWSPDGQQILFVSNRSGELQLWTMNADGSDPKQLTDDLPSMDPAWRHE